MTTVDRNKIDKPDSAAGVNKKVVWFVAAGLLVAFILAGVVSNFASQSPDGLDSASLQGCTTDEKGNITGGSCMAQQAKNHQFAGGLLADYGIKGIDNPYLATGLSGAAGVLVTFVIGGGVFWLVRRRGRAQTAGPADSTGREGEA